MQTSSTSILGLLFLTATAWAASSVSCASIGSGCIRNSDCSSGQICLASTCQIDPGSIEPQDAGDAEAAPVVDSSTMPEPNDSSKVDVDAEAAAPDVSVIVPAPDANSTDVSPDHADGNDAFDAPSESDALDSPSDASEGD